MPLSTAFVALANVCHGRYVFMYSACKVNDVDGLTSGMLGLKISEPCQEWDDFSLLNQLEGSFFDMV